MRPMRPAARQTFQETALAKRRRAKRSRRAYLWGALLVLLYGSLWWLAREEAFAVGAVRVEGSTVTPASEIEAAARAELASPFWSLAPGTNVYLAPRGAIERAVRGRFPEVADAAVSREGTDLVVRISERERFAYWCRGEGAAEECFAMGRDGSIFAAETPPPGALRFHGLVTGDPVRKRYVSPEIFANLRAAVEALLAGGLRPVEVSGGSGADFRVLLAEGPYLLVDGTVDGAKAVANLRLALGSPGLSQVSRLEYADVRLPKRVFLKPLPEAPAEVPIEATE